MERQEILTDIEYDIIDELYFVTPYTRLKEETQYDDEQLHKALRSLASDGLIRVYLSMEEEALPALIDLERKYKTYYYLATKKGLFEHNTR